ncbi:MAG: methylated-DNA--[protein]-cysteine S-methyltransferase [Halobacteriota archaeon]
MAEEPVGEDGTYARYFTYLDAHLQFVVHDGAVVEVSFPDRPAAEAVDQHPLFDRVHDYLGGTVSDDFDDVPIALDLPDDVRRVLEVVREIPYGTAMSVAELLREMDGLDPESGDDEEFIREALDCNPTPLFVPDHRVRDAPSGAPPPIEQRLRSLERIVT